MTLLSANLNKVALLRNTRAIGIPSVERAAHLVLDAGAHGITVHPRPDGRHVRANDLREIAAILRERHGTEFDIEGNPFHGLLEVSIGHALIADALELVLAEAVRQYLDAIRRGAEGKAK